MDKIRYEVRTSHNNIISEFHYDSVSSGILPFGPHWHSDFELLYITNGTTQIRINNHIVVAKRGDLVIIPCNTIHSITSLDGLSKHHTIILNTPLCESLGFNVQTSEFELKANDNKISEIVETIVYDWYTNSEFSKAKIFSEAIHLLIHIFTNFKTSTKNIESINALKTITKAFAYIDSNFHKSITIGEIAQHVGLSESHFRSIFKSTTAISPVQYINIIRCYKATEFIQQHTLSLSEISYSCGFKDVSYFTKIYKKYIGKLPSEMQKHS